ncbi:MAG: lipopolysaccharide kinase InaA family protein [Desulfobacteraceae bacterium]
MSLGRDYQEIKCTRVLRNLPGKRLVCAGESNGQKIVAKFFLDPRKGKTHCRREEQGLSALAEAGINTSEILFRAAIDATGEMPVLVFRMLEDAIDFTVAWEQVDTDLRRERLIENFAVVTALMHEAGLIHKDAHLGNFMVSGRRLYAIDGGAVGTRNKGRSLSPHKSIKNLAAVFAQFDSWVDFFFDGAFAAYAKKRKWTKNPSYMNLLTKQIHNQRRKRYKKHLRKLYRESSAQICSNGWNHFMVCKRECYTSEMACLLTDIEAFIAKGKILKAGNSSTVSLVTTDHSVIVIKRYNIKSFWHALSRCARPSRAWRSWENAHRLSIIGVATPRPVALLEKRLGPFRSRAYYITEYVAGLDAYHWFNAENLEIGEVQEVVAQFRQLLNKFHDSLITHGDFKATNFIVSEHGLVVTDLDAMQTHKRAGLRFRRKYRKDLRQLMQNWTDMLVKRNEFAAILKNKGGFNG